MATPAQIAANRANSKHSTGPVTPEGKAKVAVNRLSHGLAGPFHLLIGESPTEFDQLLESLAEEYQPQTPTDFHYLNEAVQNMFRLSRASLLEVEVFEGHGRLDLVLRYTNAARRALNLALKHLAAARKGRQVVPTKEQPLPGFPDPPQIGFESQNACGVVAAASVRRE